MIKNNFNMRYKDLILNVSFIPYLIYDANY